MKTFRFYVASISYLHYDIEAEDEDEARNIYEDTDGGVFEEDSGDWELQQIAVIGDDGSIQNFI